MLTGLPKLQYTSSKKIYFYYLKEERRLYKRRLITQYTRAVSPMWSKCPICLVQHRFLTGASILPHRMNICPDCKRFIFFEYKNRLKILIAKSKFQALFFPVLKKEILLVALHPNRISQTGFIENW